MKRSLLQFIALFSLLPGLVSCSGEAPIAPKKVTVVEAVFASGHIISDQEYQVTANAEGYLSQRFVEEGARVTAGMPLFELSNSIQTENLATAQANYEDALQKLRPNSPERLQLEEQVEQARLQLELDQKNYERYTRLMASGAVSRLDFEKAQFQYENSNRALSIRTQALEDLINDLKLNLQNAANQLAIQQEYLGDSYLSSTIDGEVLQVFKQPGELVRKGEVVAVIGGGEKLAKLFISEDDILSIHENQEVVISLNTNLDTTYAGTVSKVFPAFDQAEQSFVVEARFDASPSRLFYGTQLQANILVDERSQATVIPADYLTENDSLLLANGEYQAVEVRSRSKNWVELKEGTNLPSTLQKPEGK